MESRIEQISLFFFFFSLQKTINKAQCIEHEAVRTRSCTCTTMATTTIEIWTQRPIVHVSSYQFTTRTHKERANERARGKIRVRYCALIANACAFVVSKRYPIQYTQKCIWVGSIGRVRFIFIPMGSVFFLRSGKVRTAHASTQGNTHMLIVHSFLLYFFFRWLFISDDVDSYYLFIIFFCLILLSFLSSYFQIIVGCVYFPFSCAFFFGLLLFKILCVWVCLLERVLFSRPMVSSHGYTQRPECLRV